MMKGLKTIAIVALMLCLYVFSATADLSSVISEVEVNDEVLTEGDTNYLSVDRGDVIDIEVKVNDTVDHENVEIMAFISGYEFNNIEPMSDTSSIFDMDNNTKYVKKLSLRIPTEVEEDQYKLRVVVSDRDSFTVIKNYKLKLDAPRHGFQIEDVVFSPGTVVEAGRALLTTVRIENMGDKEEDSVKVSVAIPALGISASDFIDEIKVDDSETSEEMYMRVPVCAEAGDYRAVIEVRYNELRESVYEEAIITVMDGDACSAKAANEGPQTIIAVGATSQDLVAGEQGALYPLTITNNGANAMAYNVVVEGTDDFAEVEVNPVSNFVLNGGDSQAVFVYLKPVEDATSGKNVFTISVKSGNDVLKQIPLTANVEGDAKEGMSLTSALEIGLVVLIILLIVLVVVVGIKKLKKDDEDMDDEDIEGKTYY